MDKKYKENMNIFFDYEINNVVSDVMKHKKFLDERGLKLFKDNVLLRFRKVRKEIFEKIVNKYKEGYKEYFKLFYLLEKLKKGVYIDDIDSSIKDEYNISDQEYDYLIKNIKLFSMKYSDYVDRIKNGSFKGNLDLEGIELEGDLRFLEVLGIKEVKGYFDCSENPNLMSLKGSPKIVEGNYLCKDCGLEELNMGDNVIIFGSFNCNRNKDLKSLRNGPKKVGWAYSCCGCNLKEIDIDKNVKILYNLECLEGNNVTKSQVEEYVRDNNINIYGKIE